MKKHYFIGIFIFLLITALTFFTCVRFNNSLGVLKNGEIYSDRRANSIFPLSNYHWDPKTNTYSFDLVRGSGEQQLELIYGNLPSDFLLNGSILEHSSSFSRMLLNSDMFIGNTARLDFNTNPSHAPIYVTTTDVATALLSKFDIIFSFNLGITFLMTVYALSIYLGKRSEKYLLWFAIYTGSLTLWSGLPLFINSHIQFIRHYSYGWSIILNIVICFKMFNIKPSKPFDILLSKKGILSILVSWSVLETIFPILHSDIFFYILLLFSSGALVSAFANKQKGSLLILSGHAISQGLRMAVALSDLSWVSINFHLRALQYAKLFNFPFVFSCMLLINQLFTEKFIEAEILSKELEQTNQNLDKKVLQRTLALEEQLRRRRNFMMNIFHDLRTPLFILQGCTEKIALQPELLADELPIIRERLVFTKDLVEDLFLIAKLEDRQVIFETERVPLTNLIANVISACIVEAESKCIRIETELNYNSITWGDEVRLKQAFQNLFLNAIYYTKPSGKIYISLNRYRNTAIILVRDTGIGIAPQDINKIFERYYRISGKEKHQSTGLGLSIAYEIIQQHQGSISVDSEVGIGTTFTVQLPILH